MTRNGPSDLASAIDVIGKLRVDIAAAQSQIGDCMRHLEEEQQLLNDVVSTAGERDPEYVRLTKEACRLGIDAWHLSIAAYRSDIENAQARIDAVTATFPMANT